LTVSVEALLLHLISAVAVNDKVFKNRFAFAFAGKVVLLTFIDQIVCAFVVEALVPSVSTSAWFAGKPFCGDLVSVVYQACVVVACCLC
jgi:hypothetical protein